MNLCTVVGIIDSKATPAKQGKYIKNCIEFINKQVNVDVSLKQCIIGRSDSCIFEIDVVS